MKRFTPTSVGKLVGYTTAISPVELFVAHDVIPIYPENHAVANLTAKMGTELSMATECMGYSSHLCTYARSDLGYRLTGKSATGRNTRTRSAHGLQCPVLYPYQVVPGPLEAGQRPSHLHLRHA